MTESRDDSKDLPAQPEKGEVVEERTSKEEWLKIRKEAGSRIDPVTAEVDWEYGYTMDPYGVYDDLDDEEKQVGREYFARAPGSDIWVSFGDLSREVRAKLWERHGQQLAFPAGLVFPPTPIR